MSEEAKKTEEAPKKKGKLPVFIALLGMLLAGGFFGMKLKGGGAPKKEEIKLSAEIVDLTELITNLRDSGAYARLEIGLQPKEGFAKEEIEKYKGAIRDSIIGVLHDTSQSQVESKEGLRQLKNTLAAAINEAIEQAAPPDPKKKKDEAAADGKDGEQDTKDGEKQEGKKSEEPKQKIPSDWNSSTGPILKVYFNNFATQ